MLVKPKTNILFLLKENDSKEVATSLTRKEMRMINRLRRNKNKGQNKGGSSLIEQVFNILEAIAKNN